MKWDGVAICKKWFACHSQQAWRCRPIRWSCQQQIVYGWRKRHDEIRHGGLRLVPEKNVTGLRRSFRGRPCICILEENAPANDFSINDAWGVLEYPTLTRNENVNKVVCFGPFTAVIDRSRQEEIHRHSMSLEDDRAFPWALRNIYERYYRLWMG